MINRFQLYSLVRFKNGGQFYLPFVMNNDHFKMAEQNVFCKMVLYGISFERELKNIFIVI